MKLRGKTQAEFIITDRELEAFLKTGQRTAVKQTEPSSKDRYWLSFEIPRLFDLQYRIWCRLAGRDPQRTLPLLVFDAMARDTLGRTHLEAMGPKKRDWLKLAEAAGWKLNGKGQLRKK